MPSDDLLWKIISRFDHYINTTNTKATVIVAFDTFIVSAIILKWSDLLQTFGPQSVAAVLVSLLLLIAAVSSLVSLASVFQVINPFLKSPKSPTKYHSKIFFGHIAEFETPEDYHQCVKNLNNEELLRDCCMQAHVLAQGLNDKFRKMKIAIGAILFVQLPALGLMILVKISAVIWALI